MIFRCMNPQIKDPYGFICKYVMTKNQCTKNHENNYLFFDLCYCNC